MSILSQLLDRKDHKTGIYTLSLFVEGGRHPEETLLMTGPVFSSGAKSQIVTDVTEDIKDRLGFKFSSDFTLLHELSHNHYMPPFDSYDVLAVFLSYVHHVSDLLTDARLSAFGRHPVTMPLRHTLLSIHERYNSGDKPGVLKGDQNLWVHVAGNEDNIAPVYRKIPAFRNL